MEEKSPFLDKRNGRLGRTSATALMVYATALNHPKEAIFVVSKNRRNWLENVAGKDGYFFCDHRDDKEALWKQVFKLMKTLKTEGIYVGKYEGDQWIAYDPEMAEKQYKEAKEKTNGIQKN